MSELKQNQEDPFIRASEAFQLFSSILNSYAGIFRVQSGYIQTIRMRLVNLGSDPTTGEVGDLVVVGGKLKICTVASQTAPTWVPVGTQT